MPTYSSNVGAISGGLITNFQLDDNITIVDGVDDGGASASIRDKDFTTSEISDPDSKIYSSVFHANNFYRRNEIDLFNKTYRFGLFNPWEAATTTREFLFFTKPDLNIYARDDDSGMLMGGPVLNETLQSYAYWKDLIKSKKRIINLLQSSADETDNFNHLLQNQVISNLEIPGLTAETIETPTNMYGVGFSYRGSSEASDDSFDFSLEFRDTKWLDVYYFFKTYEEYETLKHHGTIAPYRGYIESKVIHDQFSIYKFLVDEDMETIIYYSKFFGVMPKSLPRDVFSSATFDNGISYSVDFRAAFFEDMKPEILNDFNYISAPYYTSLPYQIDVYNDIFDRVDGRPAQAACVFKEDSKYSPNGYVYKLKWRGGNRL